MENLQVLANVILSGFGLFVVWYLLAIAYPNVVTDAFRHRVFVLRDELFLLGADGVVPFDHPAYRHLRSSMNGLLRFGHRISMGDFFWLRKWLRKPVLAGEAAKERVAWEAAISSLPPEARAHVQRIRTSLFAVVTDHLVMNAPGFVLIALIIAIPLGAGTGGTTNSWNGGAGDRC